MINHLDTTQIDCKLNRSSHFGWPNVYPFTKAMGEMLVEQHTEDLPVVIIRPTMVTSTYQDPFPGWIEGARYIHIFVTYTCQFIKCCNYVRLYTYYSAYELCYHFIFRTIDAMIVAYDKQSFPCFIGDRKDILDVVSNTQCHSYVQAIGDVDISIEQPNYLTLIMLNLDIEINSPYMYAGSCRHGSKCNTCSHSCSLERQSTNHLPRELITPEPASRLPY